MFIPERKAETKFINSVMVPCGNKFKAGLASPIFHEYHKKYEDKYWDKSSIGVPRGIAAVTWGSEEKLDAAVRAGQCKEAVEDGETYYTWKTIKVGNRGGSESTKMLKGPQRNVTQDEYDKLAEYFSKMEWRFNYSQKEEQAIIHVVVFL